MMLTAFSDSDSPGTTSEDLLATVLDVSLAGAALLRPIAAEGSAEITDFEYIYLNPSAQRLLGYPVRPALSHQAAYPTQADTLAHYCDAFLSGQPSYFVATYQRAAAHCQLQVAARRSGELLVLSLAEVVPEANGPATRRESQQRELAAQATAELQRQQLYQILAQAPAMICIFDGPQHTFEFVNPPYQALVGQRPLVGLPIAKAMPELAGQPIFGLLDQVYRTGETYYAHEVLVQLDHGNEGQRDFEKHYYNFIYQARRTEQGTIDGIFVFAYDVTAQVLARQQVARQEERTNQLNEELANTNEELQTANEDLNSSYLELLATQTELRYLNQELEARVANRTQALAAALRQTERQREQPHQQEQHLQQILGQVPAAVATLEGPDYRHTYFNKGYQLLSGARTELGMPLAAVFPEMEEQGFIALLDEVYAIGQPFSGHETLAYFYNRATGQPEQRYLDFIYQPLLNEQGRTTSILAFSLDVTERVLNRRRAEAAQAEALAAAEQLAAQREDFYRIFEQTSAAICILRGPEHQLDYFNPAYQQLFPERLQRSRPIAELQPESVAHGFVALLDQVYHTGETRVFQELPFELARQEGGPPEELFFTFTCQARRDVAGTINGILLFAYEVTDQIRARRVVEKSEKYLRRLADNVPAMIWLTDAESQCIYLNQQWYDYTGQAQAEGLGMGWTTAVHPDDLAATTTIFRDASARHAPFNMLYRLRRQDGRYRWAVDTGQPRFSRTGEFDGFVGTVFDIHEQKLAEQALQRLTTNLRVARDRAQLLNTELQASNEQLRCTNADLDNFIYTASHDLKAPITNIEGLLYHLRDYLPPTHQLAHETTPLLSMMQDSIERFQRTLEHLSDVTKLQKEHGQPTSQVPLAALVADVQLDLRPLLEATGAEVTVDLNACPAVSFSLKNLRSVVYNLLSNALKYHAPGRPVQVCISCRPEGSYLVMSVQDNGLGLDASQQAELFTMFRRFHVGIEGSGIGLYMVKKIVENAGGKLAVESTPGVGSTFSVYFRR